MQLPNALSGRSPLNFSLKKNSYFLKKCLRNFQVTEFLIFQERNIQNSCRTELFLYFRKGIFRTHAFRIFSYTSGKRYSGTLTQQNFSCTSGKEYSEPWKRHILKIASAKKYILKLLPQNSHFTNCFL